MVPGLIVCIVIIIVAFWIFRKGLKKDASSYIVPEDTRELLLAHVAFYNNLDDADVFLSSELDIRYLWFCTLAVGW